MHRGFIFQYHLRKEVFVHSTALAVSFGSREKEGEAAGTVRPIVSSLRWHINGSLSIKGEIFSGRGNRLI